MPISSTGNRRAQRGVTLIEMMIVLVIIALIVGVSFPNMIAGMDNLRLSAATRSLAAFINVAANRAERRQQAVDLTVSVRDNTVTMRSADAGLIKRLNLPPGIVVRAVWPALAEPTNEPRQFLIQPGAVSPRIGIEIANRRGARRIVRLNPITGVTEVETPEQP
jgi:prepilin-type N-terminal cleavage/methylation domain-containing protein